MSPEEAPQPPSEQAPPPPSSTPDIPAPQSPDTAPATETTAPAATQPQQAPGTEEIERRVLQGKVSDRVKAMYELAQSSSQKTEETFFICLKDENEIIRQTALSLLGEAKSILAVKPVAKVALQDPVVMVRLQAAEVLYTLGIKSALEILHISLDSGNLEKRLRALKAIELLRDPKSIAVLENTILKSNQTGPILLYRFQRTLDVLKGKIDAKNIERCERILRDAQVSFDQGSPAKAKVLVDQALGFDNQNPNAYFMLGEIYLNGEKQSAKALDSFKTAQKYGYIDQGRLLFNIGTAQLNLNQVDVAVASLQAANANKRNERYMYQLGVAFTSAGNLPAAIQSFELSVKIDADFKQGYCTLGKLYRSVGNADAAGKYQSLCDLK